MSINKFNRKAFIKYLIKNGYSLKQIFIAMRVYFPDYYDENGNYIGGSYE